MQVTALLVALISVAVALWAVRLAARLLVTRRGPVVRLIVAAAGLGYGLDEALRGTTAGTSLILVGGGAAMSLANTVRRRLGTVTFGHAPSAGAGDTADQDGAATTDTHGRVCRRGMHRVGDHQAWRLT